MISKKVVKVLLLDVPSQNSGCYKVMMNVFHPLKILYKEISKFD